MLQTLLDNKIGSDIHRRAVAAYAQSFSEAEQRLLQEILQSFHFDDTQAEALCRAAGQQSRFTPGHHCDETEEDGATGTCAHCLTPPAPPLLDYLIYRRRLEKQP